MPCNDGGYPRDDGLSDRQREALAEAFTHNSPVAELLCHVLTRISQNPGMRTMYTNLLTQNTALNRWWSDHQLRDAAKARKEREEREKKTHNDAIDRQIKALQRKKI